MVTLLAAAFLSAALLVYSAAERFCTTKMQKTI
jgi:hypothetical protein